MHACAARRRFCRRGARPGARLCPPDNVNHTRERTSNSQAVPLPIEDYALIGDCETAALVGRDGSIDWLCLPRFDSDCCFAALLGDTENGRWKIAPAHSAKSARAYRGDTLILETTFRNSEGSVLLIDFMPPKSKGRALIRIVCGLEGRVRICSELIIRFD